MDTTYKISIDIILCMEIARELENDICFCEAMKEPKRSEDTSRVWNKFKCI